MRRKAWGKADGESFHSLAHHSMDVAAVFARMMQLPIIRNRMETAAKVQLTDADCQRLSALVFLHDIGKLHPGFQAKGWPRRFAGCQVKARNSGHSGPWDRDRKRVTAWTISPI